MNRNQLRYFVSAAEHRSFTKAAEQYYISQTAVTQQIQQLEQTLGCELFDRSTRPVSLTSAGKSFLLDAKAILERMSRAQERVHDAATGLTGTLRVGYVRGYERSDLSVLMRHFHQKNGNVLISFYRCSTDVLAAGLLHQEYDIVFTWDSTNLRTQEGVTFQTVEKARLVVALYAGHPLAQPRQLTRQELRGENILYMSPDAAPDSYGDAFFMQRYAEAGYKPNILFRSADTESILMMVAAEEGISLLPDYCTDQPEPRTGTVFDRAQSKRPALLRRVFLITISIVNCHDSAFSAFSASSACSISAVSVRGSRRCRQSRHSMQCLRLSCGQRTLSSGTLIACFSSKSLIFQVM